MLLPSECAVLFDLDGVIVNSGEEHFQSFVLLGKEAGYTITREQFQHIFGKHNRDIFPILFGRELPEEEISRLSDRKEEIFRGLLAGHITPLPGVMALIPALREAGFYLGIGSSTPRANINLILGTLKLLDCFQAIASAEDVTKGKPDPQVFLLGAQRLGIPHTRCVVVEDAVAGVQAALNGGMKALAVTTNHPRESLHHAHRVVDSLEEVTPADFLALLGEA